MRKIVLFAGQMESGKDTSADLLAAAVNAAAPASRAAKGGDGPRGRGGYATRRLWTRTAFALKVKQIFCDTFGVDLEFVEKWKRIKEPPPGFLLPVRDILIDIGNGFRAYCPTVWIDYVLRLPGDLIVSDGRYLNELRAVRAAGGVVALCWRPGKENELPSPSEQELRPLLRALIASGRRGRIRKCDPGSDLADYFLVNDGGVADLKPKVAEVADLATGPAD